VGSQRDPVPEDADVAPAGSIDPTVFAGLDLLAGSVAVVDRAGNLLFLNDAAEELFEVSLRRARGQPFAAPFVGSAEFDRLLAEALAGKFDERRTELTNTRPGREALELLTDVTVVIASMGFVVFEFRPDLQRQRAERDERRRAAVRAGGAFTGAVQMRRGRFEQAAGGTLFLDEIGDMPAALQTRLLRVLSDGRFYRVGGHQTLAADCRVIAATNQDLESHVVSGAFREDLLHRLDVIRLRLPRLRERSEDIALLANHFMSRSAREHGVAPKKLGADAVAALERFEWPGNVRQLQNVCNWLTVMAPSQVVTANDLPPEIRRATALASSESLPGTAGVGADQSYAGGGFSAGQGSGAGAGLVVTQWRELLAAEVRARVAAQSGEPAAAASAALMAALGAGGSA